MSFTSFTPFEAALAWTGIGITLFGLIGGLISVRVLKWLARRNFPPGE